VTDRTQEEDRRERSEGAKGVERNRWKKRENMDGEIIVRSEWGERE